MIHIIEFFVFAFVGWIIDTSYCSLWHKRIIISGYFRGVPLCPIYGFGGILLLNTFALMNGRPPWETILLTTLLVTVLEFVGGWFAEHLLEEKLWDYSKEPFNFGGYISAWHSFLWLIVVSVSYPLMGKRSYDFVQWINSRITLDKNLEVILVFVIFGLAIWATIENKNSRLSKLAKQKLDEIKSIEEVLDLEKFRDLEREKLRKIFSNENITHLHNKIESFRDSLKQ